MKSISFDIDRQCLGVVIGKGGSNIKAIQREFNVRVSIDGNGRVSITGYSQNSCWDAMAHIVAMVDLRATAKPDRHSEFLAANKALLNGMGAPLRCYEIAELDTSGSSRIDDVVHMLGLNFRFDQASKQHSYTSPGVPPIYIPLKLGLKLKSDKECILETTGTNAMELVLDALVRKWESEGTLNKFKNYKIICTQRALNRLFRMCNQKQMSKDRSKKYSTLRNSFRIDIERFGNLLLMDRSGQEAGGNHKLLNDLFTRIGKQLAPEYSGSIVEMYRLAIGLESSTLSDVAQSEKQNNGQQLVDLIDTNASYRGELITDGQTGEFDVYDAYTASIRYGPEEQGNKQWCQMYFTDSKRGLLVRHDNGVTTEVHDKSMDELTTMIGGFPQTQLNMFHDLLTRIIDDIGKQPSDRIYFTLLVEDCLSGRIQLYNLPSLLVSTSENLKTAKYIREIICRHS